VQTISVPWTASTDDRTTIAEWMRPQAAVVRSAYAQAHDASGRPLAEGALRDLLKKRFKGHPLGSWAIHCATREGMSLRALRPDGKVVFGGRDRLERLQKGLIDRKEWRRIRHSRPIEIVGDRTRWGNRHMRLSPDGLTATVTFLKRSVTLHLPQMTGKAGILMRALAALTEACEIGVQFSLGAKTISFAFDPMDMRRLTPGTTLEATKEAEREALGRRKKGRPRKDPNTHYAADRVRPIDPSVRPVHPEWRAPIPYMTTRAVALDLNPEWIGISVIEIAANADPRDIDSVRILDHRLVKLEIPIDSANEAMTAHMARAARMAVSLARRWSADTIWHEDGLGRLRWSKKSRSGPKLQTINHWSRNALLGGLARRCALSGIQCRAVWGGYSSTIGNLLFPLPDACAAATEIARRGIGQSRGEKDRLPAIPPRVRFRRWKDGDLPESNAKAIDDAGCWATIHRAVKPVQGRGFAPAVGYRRLHPEMGTGPHEGDGYAVSRNGSRKGGWRSAARPRA
jgi:hypothetical protein